MGWIDNIMPSVYTWKNRVTEVFRPGGSTAGYVNPEDDEEDTTTTYETYSYVVYGTPLRETKCLFVPEIPDFFSDAELNTTYHSKEEYASAVEKYGLVYKSQKFQNADTPQKLLEYAADWIRNNYHGGITNFNVTALDLHLENEEFRKLLTGQRVNVVYMDPVLRRETSQTLTVIAAEYDLNNPEKNSYQIGIPDVTLNKVYGETSKSGGGGGGGGKTSDKTDDETNTEVEGLVDEFQEDMSQKMELMWGMMYKGAKNGDSDFQLGDLLTPNAKDPTSDWTYGWSADTMSASRFQGGEAIINSMKAAWLKATGGIDAKKASLGDVKTTTLVVTNNATTKNVTAEEKVKGKDGEFDTLTVGGQPVTPQEDPPELPTVDIRINNIDYRLYGKRLTNN